MRETRVCKSPDETLELGEEIGESLVSGDVVLLSGGLGAGKTLLAKGILNAFEFDIDEVTSPSFTLVNLYKTERFDVYHIDLWRLETGIAEAIGLDDILNSENAVAIIEWAEKLGKAKFQSRIIEIKIEGDGDEPRRIEIKPLRTL